MSHVLRAALVLAVLSACGSSDQPAVGTVEAAALLPCCETPSRFAATPPSDAPAGMVWIPAGEFDMGGFGPEARPDELPVHRVRLEGFWIDATEVTNAQFARFVEETGYVTLAERKPDWEEIKKQVEPGTPKPDESMLVAASLVFTPTKGPVPLDDYTQWWTWMPGANWRHPEGPASDLVGKDDHPVVHVAWDDAIVYCVWAKKRLPSEAEWEYACRGGTEHKRFPWGDEPPTGKNPPANVWQGQFPYDNTVADGHRLTAPVKSFPANFYGLYDMGGNVWEWCQDWYRPDTYAETAKTVVALNPQGPASSFDPDEPYMPKRIQRGGSFLCSDHFCTSYRPSARMKTSPDTGMSHTGFRCVRSERSVQTPPVPK